MSRSTPLRVLLACSCALIPSTASPGQDADPPAVQLDLSDPFDRLRALQSELDQLSVSPPPTLEILRQRREAEARSLLSEIDRVEKEIEVALIGFEDEEYTSVFDEEPADLQAELEEFFQPFVELLRSATAQSKEIESIRRELAGLEEQQALAEDAIERLSDPELELASIGQQLERRVGDLRSQWLERLQTTESRIAGLRARLELVQAGDPDEKASVSAPVRFLRDRIVTLALGVVAGSVVWVLLALVGAALRRASRQRHVNRLQGGGLGVPIRAARLLFRVLSVGAAIVAALAVFNARNDWLLLGLGALLLIGLAWTLVKSLPETFEQVRTLLNLGAVQEGERLRFDGVPWLVAELDFHTRLENPDLEGGELSLPVAELSGLHSRPVAPGEGWFPSAKGDWVLLDDDKIAQVVVQTPGYVTLRRLGGATIMIPASSFVDEPPVNLSHGFRVELEFGLDYGLQGESTTRVLDTMRAWLTKRLPGCLPADSLRNLEVEFFAAGGSSLDYEIEVDLAGHAASEYEEVGRILSRLLVDCCNEHGWSIPFPQLQVHGVTEGA